MKVEKILVILKGYREGGAGLQSEGPFGTRRLAGEREQSLWEEEWWSFFYDGCGGAAFPGLSEAKRRLDLLPNRSIFWTSIVEAEVPAEDIDKLLYENKS